MPFTDCKMLITQGKNKGKECGDVCRKCRHIYNECPGCYKGFNRDTVYLEHIKICKARLLSKRVKPVIKPRAETQSSSSEILLRLIDKVEKLEKMCLKQEQPVITNITNITNVTYQQLINISDTGAYKTLCDKMGINEATTFLCKLANKPQIMDLFEKVYLDCDPSNYPIANNNGKDFFYRDSNDNIIHDVDGRKISKLGERLIKNTFIEAIEPLLDRFVKQNEGEHDGDDDDYDRIRELQNGAYSTKEDKTFIKTLYPKTYNPNHEFFSELKKSLM